MVIYPQISLFCPILTTNPLRNFPIEGSIFCETEIMVPPPRIKTNYWKCHLFPTPPLPEFYDSPMEFAAHNPLRTVSQNSRPEWDAASAYGPVGKPHPASITNSGSYFPPRPSTGNGIPFLGRILGCGFHRAPQRETASHSKGGTHFPKPHPSGNPIPLRTHPGIEQSAY